VSFPSSPANGQKYNNYVYDESNGLWKYQEYKEVPESLFYMDQAWLSGGENVQVAANGKSKHGSSSGAARFNKQSYTISMWFKYDENGNYTMLWSYDYTSHVSPHYAQHIRVDSGGHIQWHSGASVAVSGAVSPGNWYHLLAAREPGNHSLYLNNTLIGSNSYSGSINYYDQEVWIGKTNWGTTLPFAFKHARFYDRVVTAEERQLLYDEFFSSNKKYIEG